MNNTKVENCRCCTQAHRDAELETDCIPLVQGLLISISHETETVASALAHVTICCAAWGMLVHALRDTVAITLTGPALQSLLMRSFLHVLHLQVWGCV